MALTTLFGTVQLALQESLSGNLDTSGPNARVPNFIIVSLNRDPFAAQFRGPAEEERARFRRDLESGVKDFLASHGWRPGGSGTLVVNVLLRTLDRDFTVQTRVADSLYELKIVDDQGERTVQVKGNPAVIGRAHDGPPRGFVPVHDGAKLISREHLILRFGDLALTARLVGRNTTTLNDVPLSTEEVPLHRGDVIACGRCRIEVAQL